VVWRNTKFVNEGRGECALAENYEQESGNGFKNDSRSFSNHWGHSGAGRAYADIAGISVQVGKARQRDEAEVLIASSLLDGFFVPCVSRGAGGHDRWTGVARYRNCKQDAPRMITTQEDAGMYWGAVKQRERWFWQHEKGFRG
jgi:hypothetical protein